jgi:uncharacterized RDD family membrane protein YckC
MASSFDNISIETPEQTALEFPLAGIGSRFLAMLADTAIQVVTAVVLALVALYLLPVTRLATVLGPQWLVASGIILLFLINSGYFAFFEAIWNGQTPGKRFAQIRVIKDDGRPISAYDSIARNLLRIVDELPSMYFVGVISILFSGQNKRLGDYVAGTIVIHEKRIQDARPFLETKKNAAWPALDTSQITPDELRMIETFLHRRDSFEPALRTAMAAKISKRIGEKVGTSVFGWPQTENFLEAVYEQYRSTGRFHS